MTLDRLPVIAGTDETHYRLVKRMTENLDNHSTYNKATETADLLAMLADFDVEIEIEDNPEVWKRLTTKYSERNAALILLQMPTATDVAAFGAWRARGRMVMKGQKSLRILAPAGVKEEEKNGKKEVVRRFFKAISVFDISQTEEAKK